MRMLVIGCGLIALAVVAVVLFRRPIASTAPVPPASPRPPSKAQPAGEEPERSQASPSTVTSTSPTAPGAVAPEMTGQPTVSTPGRPKPPSDLTGFWSWSTDHQETAVTLIQDDPNWSRELRAFMLQALQIRELSLVARNNIAAGLLRQTPPLPEFEPLLLRMCDDQTEDPEWRNYTLQFLAELLPTATDPARVEQVLRSFAAAESDPRAATAVLHLARLGEAGVVVLDATFDVQVLALVQNPQQPPYARATALAVAGDRRMVGAVVLARALAEPGHPSDLRRAAMGVLGRSDDPQDQGLLQQYAQDPDPSVQRVALANIKKL